MTAEPMICFWFGAGVILAVGVVESELLHWGTYEQQMRLPLKIAKQQVMTKGPKKAEAGKRLAEYNHRKRG